jgi:hypothetical protein
VFCCNDEHQQQQNACRLTAMLRLKALEVRDILVERLFADVEMQRAI